MRIGIYAGRFEPSEGGGYTFQRLILLGLQKRANQTNHQFVIFYSGRLTEGVNSQHSVYLRWNYFDRLKSRVVGKLKLHPVTRLQHYVQQYHVHMVWFTSYEFESVNVPYIYPVWDLQHRIRPWFPEVGNLATWSSREKMFKAALQRASFILTGTEAGKNELISYYNVNPSLIRKLPHPTPPVLDIEEGNLNGLVPRDQVGKYIFYPAQFWPHKNHVRILESLVLLKTSFKWTLSVVFCGADKGNLKYLKQLVKKWNLEEQVIFLDFVAPSQLVALYKNAFALTYASYFGPENLPPLEAFALGCPVIAADVDGVAEQLGNASYFFHPDDAAALAANLLELRNDQIRRDDLIAKGFQRANRYLSEHYISDMFNIFDEMSSVLRCWTD